MRLLSYLEATGHSYVDAVDLSKTTAEMLHTMGVRDVFTLLSVIFISITIVVLWIFHTIKSRKDPLHRWMR